MILLALALAPVLVAAPATPAPAPKTMPSAAPASPASSSFSPVSLERIQQEPPLDGRRPTAAALSPGGRWVTFLKPSVDDSEVLDLWARPLPTGEARLLVATKDLLGGKSQKLTEQERMALERKRISKRGITSYQWCGVDDKTLLFPLSGDLYLARLGDKGPEAVRLTNDDDTPEQNPDCNTDGSQVAYVKNGNVVVHDLKSNKTKQLTRGSSDTLSFGLPEFIAEEELDRHEGFWWSKDGARLLILKVDESPVGIKVRAQIFADKTEMVSQRYPAAGEKNAVVTPLIVNVKSGKTVTVAMPRDAEYVARGGWSKTEAVLQLLTRDQTKLTVLGVDPKSGKTHEIVVDKDDAWVELHDDLHELKRGLLWSSEASGRRQIELLLPSADPKGPTAPARTTLTGQPEPVGGVVCATELIKDGSATGTLRVVFTGAAARGRAQHVFVLEGTETRPLTRGDSWSTADADKGCTTLLVTTSSWGAPPVTTIVDIQSGKTLGDVAGDPADPLLAKIAPATPRWLDLTAADGATMLNGLYLPPAPSSKDTKGKKHAVITFAYGGPGGQVVAHRWARNFPLFTHWQQQGFGVFLVDTRGMASRDRSFTRAHKNAFGKVEVDDLFAAVRQLPTLVKDVDAARIGMFGWSYGGTLTTRSMLDDNTPFAAGAAVAPVTDWTLYDTAYTERYIGMPELPNGGGKAPGYASSTLLTRAKLLQKPLLLVHGTADDNVLFEHTLRLVQALEDEGALFQIQLYPGKAHGIAGKKAQLHLHKSLTDFFVDALQP